MSLLNVCFIILLLQLLALVYIPGPVHARTPGSFAAYQKPHQQMKVEEKRILTWRNNVEDENIMGAVKYKEGKHRTSKKQLAQIEKRMGSRPPLCSNKCNACNPCEAVQVPTPLLHSRSRPPKKKINTSSNYNFFHLDYSNYQPEGWKCKCGSLIYNP